jgi:hypothetical protein
MFDFGSILGSSPDRRWSGVEYMYEGRPTVLGLLSFGFWLQPWQRIRYPRDLPASVGRIQGDVFDPAAWKPEYPNPAFDNMDPHDAFWAARIVARFSNEAIAAAVDRAEYSDPRAAEYITSVLTRRRDAIARRWLASINPIVSVALDAGGRLTFENAAAQAGVAAAPDGYILSWSRFDNATDSHEAVGGEATLAGAVGRLPPALANAEYVAVAIRSRQPEHPAWSQPVRAYFRRSGAGWITVGLERL